MCPLGFTKKIRPACGLSILRAEGKDSVEEILGPLSFVRFMDREHAGVNLFILELLFWVAVILLTWALVRYRPALLEKAEARVRAVSQYQRFWVVGFGLLLIAIRVSLLPLIPVPVPAVHDEFSYLLASDTFSHGRLTNPPSPMWQYFESFHINVQPTYQSMYPPAQGFALALGQTLFHSPWAGVLISTALMCSAIYWMLLGWLPAPWAWLGGALAVVRFGVFSFWLNSYMGGSVAAFGGALVLGAFPRLLQKLTVRDGLVMATGLFIMANSRPLEGFLFSVPMLAVMGLTLIKNARINWRATLAVALPAVLLLVAGAGWMLYYNWRGTGNAFLMPYEVNFQAYHITRPFFFQKANPVPHYDYEAMRAVYVFHELPNLLMAKQNFGYLVKNRVSTYYIFFLWPFLLLVGPCAYEIWRSPLRVVLISVAFVIACLLMQVWQAQPHYAAPAAGAVFLLVLFSLRHFRNSRSQYTVWGARALVIVFALVLVFPIAQILYDPYGITGFVTQERGAKQQKIDPVLQNIERDRIERELEARGGKHLVIVHYEFGDIPTTEWVYNKADLNNASVIWARDRGYEENKPLLNYYAGRQVWYVVHTDPIAQLMPYDQAMGALEMAYDGTPAEIAPPLNSKRPPQAASTRTAPSPHSKPEFSAGVSQ